MLITFYDPYGEMLMLERASRHLAAHAEDAPIPPVSPDEPVYVVEQRFASGRLMSRVALSGFKSGDMAPSRYDQAEEIYGRRINNEPFDILRLRRERFANLNSLPAFKLENGLIGRQLPLDEVV